MTLLSRTPRFVRVLLLLAACAVLPPFIARLAPGVVKETYTLSLGLGVCYAAAALSLNLLMGYAGQISLGHFALLGVGAFGSGVITAPTRLGLPFALGLVVAAVCGALVAFVIGLPALRLRGLYLAIVTIGFSYAMAESVFRYKRLTGGSAGIEVPRPLVGTFQFLANADYLALLLVLLVVLWAVDVNVTRSRLGRAFQAIRADESVAQAYGIDVARYKLLAFVISGAIAGIAGAMYGALSGYVNADSFRFDYSLFLVIVVVIGGLGSRPGVVIAAFLYAALPQLFRGLREWDVLVGSALLLYAVTKHPGGVAQALQEGRERRAARARARAGDDGDDVALPRLPDLPRPVGLDERPREAEGTPLLRARNVTVRYGGLVAVDDASLEVPRGRIVGLIGPNGAGKTTLFNAISGLVRTDSGRMELLGRDVTAAGPHARAAAGIGRTFQLIGLAKDLSVTENLLLAQHSVARYSVSEALLTLPRSRRAERELRERATEAVRALGFERYADTPVKFLSHGQQRIVELGCVLVTAPELYVLDAGRVIASGVAREVAALPEVVGAYLGEGALV
ncbi:MAG: ATP-binding cassette domain-containing protein [Frankia sp.]|nr:ATP-binding cassette domain-containing protein [Frankia sp.]